MAKKESRRKKLSWIAALLCGVVLTFCALTSLREKNGLDLGLPHVSLPSMESLAETFGEYTGDILGGEGTNAPDLENMPLTVHFIDVGQAKAILIQAPEKNVLIDAGESGQGQQILRYMGAVGVQQLDIIIGTHPHSDHIGGMSEVISSGIAQTVVLPIIPDAIVPTSKAYENLLKAIAEARLQITPSQPGARYELGDGAELTILAPLTEYEDLNNMSVVSRLEYGKTSFLFTGDASAASERDMLESDLQLHASVLDVGHHGSETATSAKFLQAVKPEIAVISCGLDNSYGHPRREVMQRITDEGVFILRTDFNGSVVIVSDGETIGYSTEK